MQLASSTRAQDGFMAAMSLWGKKPHQGFSSENVSLHPGATACNSTTALGVSWGQWSGTVPGATVTYDYDAFGNKVNSTGSTPNNYLYRGGFFDLDLGLYYLRARYMNPLTGRFLGRDPEDGDPSAPITLHKYLYANGDPTNRSDPSGRSAYVETIQLYRRVSVSAPVIVGLEAAKAAIACVLIWEGTKTYAESVAGPFGTVEQISPCLVIGRRSSSPPVPIVPPIAWPIDTTDPNWPEKKFDRCTQMDKDVQDAHDVAKGLGGCENDMSPSELQMRLDAWTNLFNARDKLHDQCFGGEPNAGHVDQLKQVLKVILRCEVLLR